MKSRTKVVVIGGGIAGCSTLYHLTQEGWSDVVLVERNELTSGTTWHSAAQVTNFGMNQTMVGLKSHSINLYKKLSKDPEYPINYHYADGGIRLANTEAHPAGHLRTPSFFNSRVRERGYDMVLVPWDVAPGDLSKAWEALKQVNNLAGVVVTIPHKEAIAHLCQSLEDEAREMGVCNVARRSTDGNFHGAMFDGLGFLKGLRAQGHDPKGKNVLLVGAGGAAKAIAHALAGSGVNQLRLANRTQARAEALAAQIRLRFPMLDIKASPADVNNMDFIINGTSLGMHADDPLPVPIEIIKPGMIVAEVIMQPDETLLLKQAKYLGAVAHKGVHMIANQIDLIIDHLTYQPKQ